MDITQRERLQAAFVCMDVLENNTVMVGRKRFKGSAKLERIILYLVGED